jgi:hypothetical protein
MATQPRLPGTLPAPAQARKAHAQAVQTERLALQKVEALRAAIREAREAVKLAAKARQTAEDDLDAIDAGRRPG